MECPGKKYNSNTKDARRAYHEYLHNAKMKSGDDPDNFLYTMNGYRERLKDISRPVADERYEDIILQALPAEYKRVRTATYERRDSHLADIRRMMSALYIDCLSVQTTPSWSRVVGLPYRPPRESTAPSSVTIAAIRDTARKTVSLG